MPANIEAFKKAVADGGVTDPGRAAATIQMARRAFSSGHYTSEAAAVERVLNLNGWLRKPSDKPVRKAAPLPVAAEEVVEIEEIEEVEEVVEAALPPEPTPEPIDPEPTPDSVLERASEPDEGSPDRSDGEKPDEV